MRQRTAAIFRVDANCSWTAEQTIAKSQELKSLGVEFIEQPLKADDWEGMRRVFAGVGPAGDRRRKLPRRRGCRPLPRLFPRHQHQAGEVRRDDAGAADDRLARRLGLKTMIGCMTESTVGISAIAQFLPLLDYVDMDGAVLIARDVASGVRLEKGKAVFPAENGNGVRLLDDQPT